MLATQMTVNSIPIYIEIDTVSHFVSLCRPLHGLLYFFAVIEGLRTPRLSGAAPPHRYDYTALRAQNSASLWLAYYIDKLGFVALLNDANA